MTPIGPGDQSPLQDSHAVNTEALEKEILLYVEDDYLNLHLAVEGMAKELYPRAWRRERFELVLRAAENLIRAGKLEAGELYPPGEFAAWPYEPDEAIERIRREWAQLDRPFNVGDIAWFAEPEATRRERTGRGP